MSNTAAPVSPPGERHRLHQDVLAMLLVSIGIVFYTKAVLVTSALLLLAINHKPGRYMGVS